jgi:hypothetical protein
VLIRPWSVALSRWWRTATPTRKPGLPTGRMRRARTERERSQQRRSPAASARLNPSRRQPTSSRTKAKTPLGAFAQVKGGSCWWARGDLNFEKTACCLLDVASFQARPDVTTRTRPYRRLGSVRLHLRPLVAAEVATNGCHQCQPEPLPGRSRASWQVLRSTGRLRLLRGNSAHQCVAKRH